LGAIYPFGTIACGFGGFLAVWCSGVGLGRLLGVPLVVPIAIPRASRWNGTVGPPHAQSRRPIQFTLRRLQCAILIVAVLCALARFDLVEVGKWVYLGSMLFVITVGTGVAVTRRRPSHLRDYLIYGGLAGSCLAAVCLGWMCVVLWLIDPTTRALRMLGVITVLGAMLGMIIGLAIFTWQWWQAFRR
jgi:hypothetical protein